MRKPVKLADTKSCEPASVTFGVCATSDPRIDKASRTRCVNIVEMVAGICLIIGLWPRGAVTLIAIMLVMFLIALSSVLARGIDISCGCFTVTNTGKSDVVALLWRDLLMLLACAQIYFFGKDFLSIHKLRG